MEGSSVPPSDSNANRGGASDYLANLPSRGLFSSTILSSNLGGIRVYVCDHNTSPPESQLVKTNQTNILIRSLSLKKAKSGSNLKDVNGKASTESSKGKRAAERVADTRASAKKAMTYGSNNFQQEVPSTSTSVKDFQNFKVENLRALLKERGLSAKGKKDELISRLNGESVDAKAQVEENCKGHKIAALYTARL